MSSLRSKNRLFLLKTLNCMVIMITTAIIVTFDLVPHY